ncbi:MAG: MASE1 domain-containing protein [Actinobacteria bacterium]|nr:MASE1 domain-containing protein [Actinomycetota bacterium]
MASDLVGSIGLGIAYYLAAQLSLRLALVGENITPLWPPTGIALAGFLLRGRRLWPGVAIAAFAVNLLISTSAAAAAVTTVGNTLASLAAATLLLRVGSVRSSIVSATRSRSSSWPRHRTRGAGGCSRW